MPGREPYGRNVIVAIVAGGPSAAHVPIEQLRGRCRVVAVNDSIIPIPWADCAFTADGSWLRSRALRLTTFAGEIVAALPAGFAIPKMIEDRVTRLTRLDGAAISDDPTAVHYADNSGFGAFSYECARRPDRIILIGYDLNNDGHWHSGYQWRQKFTHRYPQWAASFDVVAEQWKSLGVDVVNVNPDSAIRCFRFAKFDDALG
jgi:hypothetical protein